MHPRIKPHPSEWQDRIDIPVQMQRPMGVIFGGMAVSCAFVFAGVLAILIVQVRRGHNVGLLYFGAAVTVLVFACVVFGRIGYRLLTRRENQVGRASGRSLPSGPYFIVSFLTLIFGLLLAADFLTGAMLYIALAALSSAITSLVIRLPRGQPMPNQSTDSGMNPAGRQSRSPLHRPNPRRDRSEKALRGWTLNRQGN
jgi:hypothetical protein